ncbi:MAG: hypothetical protein DA405_08630 [Bacteroidetes bacterium]|nr:MAG: hypothetical protein DA405_08630 [Bacteroidota bacterium]
MKKISNFLSNEINQLKSINGGYKIGTRSNSGKCGLKESNGWCYDTTDTETSNSEDAQWTGSGGDAPDIKH